MRKKFGIDIDDTLIKVWEDEIFSIFNNKYKENLKYEDIKTHNFNCDERLKEVFFNYFNENYNNLGLFNGVKEKLNELRGEFDLYLITSRPAHHIEITKESIELLFGKNYFKDIIFTCNSGQDKKCELSKKIGFDIVIDDASHHIENYLKNTDIKKIIIFDQPWNRNIKEDNKRLFRVTKWKDININKYSKVDT